MAEGVAHDREEIRRLRHLGVSADQPGALLNRDVSKIKQSAVTADEDQIVALPKPPLRKIRVQSNHLGSQAEAITQVGIHLFRPAGERVQGERGRRSAGAFLFENLLRALRHDEPGEERGRQQQEYQNGEIAAVAADHIKS